MNKRLAGARIFSGVKLYPFEFSICYRAVTVVLVSGDADPSYEI
jgi:hypothetical protein